MNISHIEFPGHNAVFHAVNGLLFNRKIAFRITQIFPDQNARNLPIKNEERLKQRLFERIKKAYNMRINCAQYGLNLPGIDDSRKGSFRILKFKLIQNSFDDEYTFDYGGQYQVYPLSFACKVCGDFVHLTGKEIDKFNPKKCKKQGCPGEYEQISVMHFCETCGNVAELRWWCQDHAIRLIRPSKDSLKTWTVKCVEPSCKRYEESIDIFRFPCQHKDPFDFNNTISKNPQKSMRPLTVTEGSIFLPVVDSCVDIPKTRDIDIEDLEYILLGLYLKRFHQEIEDPSVSLEMIQSYLQAYKDEHIKKLMIQTNHEFVSLQTDQDREKAWRTYWKIDKIENIINELKSKYQSIDQIREINDFASLIGKVEQNNEGNLPYSDYIDSINDPIKKSVLNNQLNTIKKEFHIEEIIYIPQIDILLSCYGIINGINKFYDPAFIPHFEPIWSEPRKRDKFVAYTYPYQTEGILFKFDKIILCKWLTENNLTPHIPESDEEATELLIDLQPESEPYIALKTLLHTFSHILISRSSIYTGLDSQSCGEMIFPIIGAIFIYSTSNINIGGFQYIFEHEIWNWFRDIKFNIHECTLDPSCIHERGACFSCLYLPEFVCSEFNKFLDRDSFLGKYRFKKAFMGI